MEWDKSYDVVVVGSGAGGFSAAITAKMKGLSVLIVEKTDKFGGSSALSGGGVWIPNNYVTKEAGLQDSREEARLYLQSTVGDRVNPALLESYLDNGPEMLEFMRDNTRHMRFSYMKGYSDYYPEKPGGKPQGRSIEPKVFNMKKLGATKKDMRLSELPTKGMVLTSAEFAKVNMFLRTWEGFFTAIKVGIRLVCSLWPGYQPASLGEALIGRLALSYKEINGELVLNTAFKDFVMDGDRVAGITVMKNGVKQTIEAKQGVIMASGGFSHSQAKREEFLPTPTSTEWTSASPGQTGDAIDAAKKIDVKFDLLDKMWGAPSAIPPDAPPYFFVADRAIPNMMIVNQEGRRFLNEALPYEDFVNRVYAEEKRGIKSVPSWIILDQRARNHYLFMGMFPGQPFPKRWIKNGYVKVASSPESLAKQMGVPVDNFVEEFYHFNEMAAAGKDDDFGRGDSAYDRYYGDPNYKNPNLYPLQPDKLYALQVFPGDIGTKGGIVMDEYARALHNDDSIVEGLFACGNASAAIMGETYPGAGSTLGPSMTYGYIASKYMAANKNKQAK